MDFLSIDFRDPLYGIIILIIIVLMIRVSNYWARYMRKKDEDATIKKFIKTYEKSSSIIEYKDMILRNDLPLESVILMAMTYDQTGEYEKSIEIYSTLLTSVHNNKKRNHILTLLGKTYYKAGFLYKSRDIFLDAIKLFPKNSEALTYLVSIYESLREYDNAIEILNVLEHISGDMEEKKIYFRILSFLHDNSLSNEQKISKVITLGVDKKIVQRKLFEFASIHKLKLSTDILHKFCFENLIDLIWDYEGDMLSEDFIKDKKLLSEIYSAKNRGNFTDSSDNFEINTILKLKKQDDFSADLTFTYTCTHCKNVFPLYFYRCPVCKFIDSTTIDTTLTRREYETGSFV